MKDVTVINRANCDLQTVVAWSAWYEGEESWGNDDDDDDD